jgi:hypothetical protein
VQVSKDSSFSQLVDNIITEHNCWTPTKGYADQTYYWRVAMRDGEGKMGDFSDTAVFTKQYPITTFQSPSAGSRASSTPTFHWAPVDGAARYRVQVSNDQNYLQLIDNIDTNNTFWTPNRAYTAPNMYYWRVAMIDINGNAGPYSQASILLGGQPLFLPAVMDR